MMRFIRCKKLRNAVRFYLLNKSSSYKLIYIILTILLICFLNKTEQNKNNKFLTRFRWSLLRVRDSLNLANPIPYYSVWQAYSVLLLVQKLFFLKMTENSPRFQLKLEKCDQICENVCAFFIYFKYNIQLMRVNAKTIEINTECNVHCFVFLKRLVYLIILIYYTRAE